MKLVKLIVMIFCISVVVMSLIPLIRHDYWTFRVFEFPRFQKLVLNVILLIVFLFFWDYSQWKDNVLLGALILNMCYLCYLIYPYTPMAEEKIAVSEKILPDKSVSVMVANVYQYNRNASKLLDIIRKHEPDIILMVETDTWWLKATEELEQTYTHTVYQPQSNTYGMLLYSRLPLKNVEVKFLIEYGIPSIHAQAELPSGDPIQLYFIHPEPPVPDKDPRSTERDAEILLVGQMALDNPLPVIVAGDLNDVAWSYTTDLFLKTSGLKDPRLGRGFYSTFHAKHPLMRWPLDHIFCSSEFKLIHLQKLEKFGSDHFPIMIDLVLDPEPGDQKKRPKADREEMQEAKEKIEKGKEMQKDEASGED